MAAKTELRIEKTSSTMNTRARAIYSGTPFLAQRGNFTSPLRISIRNREWHVVPQRRDVAAKPENAIETNGI